MSEPEDSPVQTDRSPLPEKTTPPVSSKPGIFAVANYWKWECLCLIAAILLQVAMILILVPYNGEELPDWPHGISLNTIIAVLGTFLRASLVVILAEVISQAKWYWIDQPRPAADMQVFDQASRGIPGSLQLVWLLRFRSWSAGTLLPTLAALVTIFSLGTAPFSQQAIGTRGCSKVLKGATAYVAASNTIPGPDRFDDMDMSGQIEPGVGFKAAFINGLLNPQGNDSAPKFSCPTGNCDYGYGHDNGDSGSAMPLSTVGICSRCIDVDDHVESQTNGSRGPALYWIPDPTATKEENSTFINSEDDLSISAYKSTEKFAFQPMPWRPDFEMPEEYAEVAKYAITNITILAFTGAGEPDPKNSSAKLVYTASECALYACKQDFQAKVRDGRLEERILDTKPLPYSFAFISEPGYPDKPVGISSLVKSPCVIDAQLYTYDNFSSVPQDKSTRVWVDYPHEGKNISVPSDCLYSVNPSEYYSAMNNWFLPSFTGTCDFSLNQASGSCSDRNWFPSRLYHQGNATHQTIAEDFASLSRVLTNFLRGDGWGFSNETWVEFNDYSSTFDGDPPALPENRKGYVGGVVWDNTVCVEVSWPWLVYPSALCIITTLLLFGMAVRSYNHDGVPAWKSSILPLLLYTFVDNKPRFTEGSKDYQGVAKVTSVRLRSVNSGISESRDGSRSLDRAEVDSLLDRGPS